MNRWRIGFLVLIWWVVVGPGAPSAAAAAGASPAMPPELARLIEEALAANPELRQMGAQSRAAKETVRPAGALDDPDFQFSLKDIPTDTWRLNQDDMTQKMFMLSQKVPFPGKRRLRSEVAASQAEAETFLVRDKAREVRAKVIQAYWGLAWARGAFELTRRNKELWEQVVQAAEARYAAGQGMQTDVLQAQVELGNYLDRLFQWQQRQESFRADLNALRGQPPGAPLPAPAALSPRPLALNLEDLLARAEQNPRLGALKAGIDKQEKAVNLAKKEYLPDFTFQVAYGLRENKGDLKRPDMFTSSVMMNLPIWQASKIKPKIREEEARETAAREAHRAALTALKAAVTDRHAKLTRLAQQARLYAQGIIPQARQAAASALAAYRVGSLDFARLSQNYAAVIAAELQWQEYLKEFEENWAELEWLVGEDLPRTGGGRP
jgi:cobalt-zinc-cadmium efflux system outer membrane protein